jgi:excisionase family DNA binding protein
VPKLHPEFLTIKQVADELGRSTDFIRTEIKLQHLASHRMGGRIFISRRDLTHYIEKSRTPAVGEKQEAAAQ